MGLSFHNTCVYQIISWNARNIHEVQHPLQAVRGMAVGDELGKAPTEHSQPTESQKNQGMGSLHPRSAVIQTFAAPEQQTRGTRTVLEQPLTLHCQALSIVPVNPDIRPGKSHLGERRGALDMHAGVQKWNALDFSKLKVTFQSHHTSEMFKSHRPLPLQTSLLPAPLRWPLRRGSFSTFS